MKQAATVDPRWLEAIRLGRTTGTEASTAEDATRALIVDAAYELLLRFGLRRTTIEDIARRAGIGRPTLYRRFADKDAVVAAVLTRETERSLAAVLGELALTPARTVEDRVVHGFVLVTRTAAGHPLLVRLLEAEPELVLPHLGTNAAFVIALAQERITPLLRTMQREGHFPALDAAFAVETMVRLFLSIVLTRSAHVAHDDASLERFARAVLSPILGATGDVRAKSSKPRERVRRASER